MKKLLITILLSVLCLLFIFVSCTSQGGGLPQGTTAGEVPAGSGLPQGTTSAETPAGSEITPDETTGTDSIQSETEEETWETVAPELIEKIRIPPNADEHWLKREFPNIIDIDVRHRPSDQDFESLYFTSVENYKTLNELIEILGKPHGCINRTAHLYFVWITQEGHYKHAIALTPIDSPEGISNEEYYLNHFKMYIYPSEKYPVTEETTPPKIP